MSIDYNKLINEIINLEINIEQQYKTYNKSSSEYVNLNTQYNNYMIDIFDEKYKINYINEYEDFINNMNINCRGYYTFFTDTYIYGKILYDSLINSIENNNLISAELDIYFKVIFI